MKQLFSKKPSKKHSPVDEEDIDEFNEPQSPSNKSASPTKQSSSKGSKSPTKRSQRAASPPPREARTQPRTSRTFTRQGSDSGSSRRKKIDPDLHPLNLPPEQRKRFSELSGMSGRNSMDIDRETPPPPARASSSSPPPAANPQPQPAAAPPAHTNSFTIPLTNGTKEPKEAKEPVKPESDDSQEKETVPVPPPHRSQASSPTPAEEAEIFKNEGNKWFKTGDFQRAISFYTKAVVLQPDSATYLGNRAAAYMSAGKYNDALDDCKKAADLDPDNSKILLRLARIYTSLGRPEEAMATFSRIQPPPSAKDMAQAKEMLRHVRSAESALKDGTAASMVLHPLDMAERALPFGVTKPRKWQLMRGEALLKLGDANSLGEAQNIAMSLLRGNNQDPEALVLRGRALYAAGENDKAIQHFRKALSCDPDFKNAIKWLRVVQKLDRMKEEGNSDYKAGRWQAAIDKYTAALEIDATNKLTNSKLYQNRALARLKLKQYDEAISDCERAVALDPTYTKARKTKANALNQAERWEDAVREWKALQELEPEDRTIAKEIRKAELELKKAQRKDYYKILEVDKAADDNQIKKAYRKLAIVHHPDKNPGDAEAETRFKDISEAYETLSDPQKRARYDAGDDLVDMNDMFGGGGGMHGGIDPEILFSMMGQGGGFGGGGFGGGGFSGFGDGGGRQRPRPGFSQSHFHFG